MRGVGGEIILYTDAFITLATFDIEILIDFYSHFLEEKPRNLIPNVYAEFQLSSLKLAIFKPKSSNESQFVAANRSKISLCLEVTDLEQAIAHLKFLGYPPPGNISTASHGREIYAYDPDGNRIILHESVRKNEFNPKL